MGEGKLPRPQRLGAFPCVQSAKPVREQSRQLLFSFGYGGAQFVAAANEAARTVHARLHAETVRPPVTDSGARKHLREPRLRRAGIRTQLYTEQKKFKAKLGYADKLKIPFCLLLGEDEIREGLVSVKNMQTGEQQKLTAEEAALMIKSAIDVRNNAPIICENCE